jgi:hypothetical protein
MTSHTSRHMIGLAMLGLLVGTATATAEQLTLQLEGGRVSLVARDVSVEQVLAEWARLGSTTIVDADALDDTPITLTLEDVPEHRALETLLRSATGYVAAPRPAGTPGASRFDRILILVSRSASAPAFVSPMSPRAVNPQPPAPGGAAPASPLTGTPSGPAAPPVFPQAPAFDPTQPRILPGNPFLQPPTVGNPPPQTAPRQGIVIPLPQATPPGVRQ